MIHRLLLIWCCAAAIALGAEVSGRWSGSLKMTIDGSDLEMPQEIVLKQQGDSVSGTAGPGPEQQWEISKARLTGNELTFEVKAPDGPLFEYRLTVSGNEMTGDYKMTLEGQTSNAKIAVKKR